MTSRVLVMGAVLLTALLVTTVVAPAFSIGEVRPDIVLLTVVAFGIVDGAGTGARYGFLAGLASDLVSGPQQLVGVGALLLLSIGYLAGVARQFIGGGGLASIVGITAAASVAFVAFSALLGGLLDLAASSLGTLVSRAIVLGIYHCVLSPIVVRPVIRLSERFPGAPTTE